jgi:hypothetical protein
MDWLSQLYNPGRLRFTQALQDEYKQALLRRMAAAQQMKREPSYIERWLSQNPGTYDKGQRLQGEPWNQQAPMLDTRQPWQWLDPLRSVRG